MTAPMPFSLSDLQAHFGAAIVPGSLGDREGVAFWLDRALPAKRLAMLALTSDALLDRLQGESAAFRDGYTLLLCPLNHANALALRGFLPWLKPAPLGLVTTAGFGDRLGTATPGHVRALQRVLNDQPGSGISPIFAQQSIREMERTNRSPEDVLDDATWGAFQAGWRGALGADADHLKTTADVDACAAAGYTLYTFDPGTHVDGTVDTTPLREVHGKLDRLPWDRLESTLGELRSKYIGRRIEIEGRHLQLGEPAVTRAAAKYGAAIAHVVTMYRYLAAKGIPFEVEVSVDETDTPTSHAEHYYIASELRRLGVSWVSLAPRYAGSFEKGVDYIGDPAALQVDLQGHAAIARSLGPYKLSLHSGSDKFSVYPLITAATQRLVHLKTAGTSYLEALRVASQTVPHLFREILAFARGHYEQDRESYHVSADMRHVPDPAGLSDDQLPPLLDDFDTRQLLHVTFGSALAVFGQPLKAALAANEELHYAVLERHFLRHLRPFA